MAHTKSPYRGVMVAIVSLLIVIAVGLSRDKTGTKEGGAENTASQVSLQPAVATGQSWRTERVGIEPTSPRLGAATAVLKTARTTRNLQLSETKFAETLLGGGKWVGIAIGLVFAVAV